MNIRISVYYQSQGRRKSTPSGEAQLKVWKKAKTEVECLREQGRTDTKDGGGG